ncbi:MAG: hypothetical protein GWN00_24815, partial [Aliifodinibius sp.]|nr:hypothetical protein [Fodinibius sp.]NIV14087.1 hypothetical protein [Fodinibius sp.]NIY27908.1 hypothetical protein [Fodinibius sp.]
ILRGASPALKAAIQGSVQGGLIMAADAAAKGKPLKTGLIDTGIGAFMFGLFNAGAVKFIDTLTRRGV